MTLYYSDGGPGDATKLLRVDASPTGDHREWMRAPAFRWTPSVGWFPIVAAQLDIEQLGEFFMVDPENVPQIQQQLRERWAKAQA